MKDRRRGAPASFPHPPASAAGSFSEFRTALLTQEAGSPVTVRDVLRRLVQMQKEGVPVERVSVSAAAEYLAAGRLAGWSYAQYNNRAKALNAWLVWRDRLARAPLTLLPEPEGQDRALAPAEERAVFQLVKGSELPPLDRAVVANALGVGNRPSESARLELVDFSHEDVTLNIRFPAKLGRRRRIPIPKWTADVIAAYRYGARPTPPPGPNASALFVAEHMGKVRRLHPGSLGRIVREAGELVDVAFNWQIARHTVATRLLREGYDMRYICYYLGHKNMKSTARYAEVRFADAEARFRALPSAQEGIP